MSLSCGTVYRSILRSDLLAGVAIAEGLVVRLSGGEYVLAGASDADALGVNWNADNPQRDADVAQGDAPLVHFWLPGQVIQVVSASAFAVRVPLYQAASGRMDDTGTIMRAISLEEATGSGQLVNAMLI